VPYQRLNHVQSTRTAQDTLVCTRALNPKTLRSPIWISGSPYNKQSSTHGDDTSQSASGTNEDCLLH